MSEGARTRPSGWRGRAPPSEPTGVRCELSPTRSSSGSPSCTARSAADGCGCGGGSCTTSGRSRHRELRLRRIPHGAIFTTQQKKTKKNTHKKNTKKTKRKRTKTHPGTFRGGALARRLGPGVHVYAIWSATHIRAESYRKMNASRAVQIWQGWRKSRAGRAGTVQLDNAPEHRALLWRRWARRAGLRPLDWPSRSGDMAARAPWRARGEHADGDYSVRSVPPGFPPRTHCGCNFLR